MLEQIITEDCEPLAPYANDPLQAREQVVLHQLQRMYPTVDNLETDATMRSLILDRTMQFMMHSDGQVFDLNRIFDTDHYEMMALEAKILNDWCDSPDDTPMPDGLKYIAPDDGEEQSNPMPERYQPNSKFRKAAVIFKEDVEHGAERADTLKRFETELDISHDTGNVYYSKLKLQRK